MALDEPGRTRELRAVLSTLGAEDWHTWQTSLERLLGAGKEGLRVLLEAIPPGGSPLPSGKRMNELLALLDSDSPVDRTTARQDLRLLGASIVPWIEKRKDDKEFSREVRSALSDLYAEIRPLEPDGEDIGRVRAVLALLEMPWDESVRTALGRYSAGPRSRASTLAERALRR